ncbi:c-5 sterol desaturase [Lobulomyces angularis]|nr:c-5 sterol desaturase [Lobulomyces angularis]
MKTNPKYPNPKMVKLEITQMLKGLLSATICPSISLYMATHHMSNSFCGFGGFSLSYNLFTFVLVWILTDFYEFFYHRLGHTTDLGWSQHKFHHKFFNPTPFAVIADEYIDQFARALPLVFIPILIPINLDMLFFQYAIFFYGYGVYLHWGHELTYIDAHHPYINSSYHHYAHHALSVKNKPYYTGFYFKIWDQLFGSLYKGECICCKCLKNEKTLEKFNAVQKYDYSCLLDIQFWIDEDAWYKSKSGVTFKKEE